MLRTTTSFVAGALVALVLGTGTAYAATGGKFILGRSNTASTATTLSNTAGPAINLYGRAGHPSFRVNSGIKVTYLNADRVDNLDSTQLAKITTLGTIEDYGFVDEGDPEDPDDSTVLAFAVCPAGSQVTGGGAIDGTTDGVVLAQFPDVDPDSGESAYIVISSSTTFNDEDASGLVAYARCYNPRGNVASNNARTAPKAKAYSPSAKAEKLIAAAANKG